MIESETLADHEGGRHLLLSGGHINQHGHSVRSSVALATTNFAALEYRNTDGFCLKAATEWALSWLTGSALSASAALIRSSVGESGLPVDETAAWGWLNGDAGISAQDIIKTLAAGAAEAGDELDGSVIDHRSGDRADPICAASQGTKAQRIWRGTTSSALTPMAGHDLHGYPSGLDSSQEAAVAVLNLGTWDVDISGLAQQNRGVVLLKC